MFASSTSWIARSTQSHPATTPSFPRAAAFARTLRTAAAKSHPSTPIVCTAGMSSFEKKSSRRQRASASSPANEGACDSAAFTATRV